VNWKVKGIIQKGLSLTPGGVALNSRLQHVFGRMRDFDGHLADKIFDWSLSMEYLAEVHFPMAGARLMEIGTGWHPALPLCFYLAGAESIATFDITRLMDEGVTFRLLDSLEKHVPKIAEMAQQSPASVQARLAKLRGAKNLAELLSRSGIEYFAPADGRATGLPPASVDLVYSNSVLEHVPGEVISGLMAESLRVLRPGGLAMHNVGCNDHYAFFDKSISFVNFLQFDDREWRRWNNPIQYQNRLRAPEFVALAEGAGLEVISEKKNVRPGTLEALATMRVAPEFKRFSKDEIAITTLDFISRKPDL
jgi:hypothetical protein